MRSRPGRELWSWRPPDPPKLRKVQSDSKSQLKMTCRVSPKVTQKLTFWAEKSHFSHFSGQRSHFLSRFGREPKKSLCSYFLSHFGLFKVWGDLGAPGSQDKRVLSKCWKAQKSGAESLLFSREQFRSLGTTPISGKTLWEWKGQSRSSGSWEFPNLVLSNLVVCKS